jgi:hypothetical protein
MIKWKYETNEEIGLFYSHRKPQRGEIIVTQGNALGYKQHTIKVLACVFGTKTMTKPP